jgi:exodeoxyribonuclease V gamma subunit
MEFLFDALADGLATRRDVLEPAHIAVPNRAMERAVEVHIARHAGMAQNLRFSRIDGWLRTLLEAADVPEAVRGSKPTEGATWEALLLAVLTELGEKDPATLGTEPLATVHRWLVPSELADDPAARARRVVSLASKVASLLLAYDQKRPELCRAWLSGSPTPEGLGITEGALAYHERWQRALALAVRAKRPAPFATELLDALERAPITATSSAPLHVIGLSHATQTTLRTLAALSARREVVVYALDPCREFWEDIESAGEEARRLRKSSAGQIAAVRDDEEPSESPLLAAWGRAGREHLGALHELAGYDAEERFDSPTFDSAPDGDRPRTSLQEVQASILERRPVASVVGTPDGSLLLLPCPSVRRELEVLASEIWRRVDQGARFADIAVLLHDGERERYLPLLPSVFGEARALPWSAVDVPLVWRSPTAAGAQRLMALVTEEVTRSRLLDLLSHPAVHRLAPDARAGSWAQRLDRLGFFHGLGPQEGALGQALERLAIGAVSAGERSGVSAPIDGRFPEEIDLGGDEGGGLYRILRSLLRDLDFARRAQLSLEDWARFFDAMLSTYLVVEGPRERADLLRVRAACRGVALRHVEGALHSATVAHALFVDELERLRTEVGAPTVSGVTISTLVPMRAIPFQHVFVLGLGEGRFAGARDERGLDLTRGARLKGDIEDSERDRYTFLETLLSARASLTISWVARDEATGEALAPASVVTQLQSAAPGHLVTIKPPLRRHEDTARGAVAASALIGMDDERRARSLGDHERSELDGDAPLGPSMVLSAFRMLVAADDPRRELLTWDALGKATSAAAPDSAPTKLAPSRLAPARLAPARLAPARRPTSVAQTHLETSADSPPTDLTLRLEQVRQFLERPMQAAAEHALGQRGGPSRDRVDAPPMSLPRAMQTRLLREVVQHALEANAPPLDALLAARAARERARGRMPHGALGDRVIERLLVTAKALTSAARSILGDDRGVEGMRFGPGRRATEHRQLALPRLDLGVGARGRRVLLLGEGHAWIADEGRTLMLLDPFGDPAAGDRRSRARLDQQLLRAFVDHAALACSHRALGVLARTIYVVSPTGSASAQLLPYEEQAARGWLRALADELALGEAAFLPGEVVLGEGQRIRSHDRGLLDSLVRALERARVKEDRLGELRGPVRDPKERPAPDDLLRVVGRRFGPFFEHTQLDRGRP